MTSLPARIFRSIVHGILRGLFRAWVLIVPIVLAMGLIRGAQIAHFWPDDFHAPLSDVLAVVFQGFRFDLKVTAIAGFLLMVLFTWVSNKAYQRVVAWLAFGYVLLSFINLFYFGFYKTPIDSLVFGIVEDDTTAVLQTIWRDFPVFGTLFAIGVMTFGTSYLHRVLVRKVKPETLLQTRSMPVQLVAVALVFLALAFAGKGTLRQMALQRQHLTVTTSQFLNDMVPNGVIALKYAFDSRSQSQNLSDPLVGLKAVGFDSPEAAAEVLGMPHGSADEVKAAMYKHDPLPAGTPKKNLVFFLMESLSAEPMLYQSPKFDVLGRLAPAMEKACHFTNFESAQPGTHPSLEGILFSTPLTPLTTGDAGRKLIPWALARVAKDAGYETLFLTSVRAGWRDLDRVLRVQGFDDVVDAFSLQKMYPDATMGIWGVWDSYIFKYLKKRMAEQPKNKPLFVFVLTATNHPPYDLPPDYKPVKRDMSLWKGETDSDDLLTNLDTYHYAADQLGGFIQDFENGPLKDTTVIGATGDHNVRSFGVYADPKRRYLMRQVPFLVWGANQPCGNQLNLPASHRDMFPTLFPLAGIEGNYVNTGRNLLKPLPAKPDPVNAPRGLFFSGDARNSDGMWTLGNKASFTCTSATKSVNGPDCQFNALDDLQERARYGLLDWNVRSGIFKK